MYLFGSSLIHYTVLFFFFFFFFFYLYAWCNVSFLFIFGTTRTKFVFPRRPVQVFCSVTTCIKSCTIFQGISLH